MYSKSNPSNTLHYVPRSHSPTSPTPTHTHRTHTTYTHSTTLVLGRVLAALLLRHALVLHGALHAPLARAHLPRFSAVTDALLSVHLALLVQDTHLLQHLNRALLSDPLALQRVRVPGLVHVVVVSTI
eukprot:GDKK01057182.1.p1 GENE.GDKK01057182.1~~GDKK01057182.1.p1  ORF type:complete len:128 (-),score=5.63 GDKK01057182.1:9-392(-)